MVKDLMGSWSSSLFVWRPFGLSQDSLAVELVASRTFRCLGSSGGSEIQEKTWNSLQKLFWLSILKCDFEKSDSKLVCNTVRDIPQILLLLGHFVIKKPPIKNCWHFLKTFMSTLKLSFNTFWNFSEHITHWKNFQILIYKTLKIGKSTFFTNFPKSSNFICL